MALMFTLPGVLATFLALVIQTRKPHWSHNHSEESFRTAQLHHLLIQKINTMDSESIRQRVLSRFNELATSLRRQLLCLGNKYSHFSPGIHNLRSSTTVKALNNVFHPHMVHGSRGRSTFSTTSVPLILLTSAEADLHDAQSKIAKGMYTGMDGADFALIKANSCLRKVREIVQGVTEKLALLERRVISKQGHALVRRQKSPFRHC
ncbi:Hypothetical protein R9X50_00520100 [Acrodontium crateriforme]|uniref:Uncharacterized protein n=1 Tax=Acrodontium crateriforme TaxID=150365 RepID=A0AAQ3RD49_9PEZI|nr:Hypothetical protein R9X50_00520100 [Acrodontium crateriforme]